jgi:hypothetical protein
MDCDEMNEKWVENDGKCGKYEDNYPKRGKMEAPGKKNENQRHKR